MAYLPVVERRVVYGKALNFELESDWLLEGEVQDSHTALLRDSTLSKFPGTQVPQTGDVWTWQRDN